MARIKTSRNWFDRVRRKFIRSPLKALLTSPQTPSVGDSKATRETVRYERLTSKTSGSLTRELTREERATIKIQATFRSHLARRAFRALRSLVKLQAMARGASVRRQTCIAMQCMHALVRLPVQVRARQLLSQCSDE